MLDAGTLSGDGVVSTDGRNMGSGGRVAIYYSTDASSLVSSLGTSSPLVTTFGKNGGGPGTIYVENKSVDPHNQGAVYVDNAGNNWREAGIVVTDSITTYSFKSINLSRQGHS